MGGVRLAVGVGVLLGLVEDLSDPWAFEKLHIRKIWHISSVGRVALAKFWSTPTESSETWEI